MRELHPDVDDSSIEVDAAAARRRSDRERGGEPLRRDDEVPRLDARDHEPVRVHPGVVGEASADLVFGLGIDDQQGAQAPLSVPASGPANRTNPSPASALMNPA